MEGAALITVDALSVTHQRWGQSVPALDRVSFSVAQGEWVLLTGHNGSGKSTLLHVLAGLLQPASGHVSVHAAPAAAPFATGLFHVAQDPLAGTADALTLLENLVAADPQARAVPRGTAKRIAHYAPLMDTFALAPRAGQLLRFFSGGERQQIALLIARLRRPRMLLLDEPFAALDAQRIPESLALVKAMHADGCTVVQVTHDHGMAIASGHRILTLERGRLVG